MKVANGTTSDPQNGFVEYQFTDNSGLSREIQSAADTDKCLDLYKGSTVNGTNIQLFECTGRAPQQWVINGMQVQLKKDPKKCIDLTGANTESNTNIQLYDCYGDKARQFWIYDGFTGAFRSAKAYWKCLHLEGGSTANDTNIDLYSCTGTKKQQWVVQEAPPLVDKSCVYIMHLAHDMDICLDLEGDNTNNASSKLIISECTGTTDDDYQHWVFGEQEHRIYLNNKDSGKCMNLYGGNTSGGTKINVHDCNDKARQRWIYDGLTQVFRSAVDLNKCIQVKNGDTADGTQVEIRTCDGSAAQQWVIE